MKLNYSDSQLDSYIARKGSKLGCA